MSTGEMTDRQIEEYEMTPIERFIVVLASFGNKAEVHHLRLFFQEWEKVLICKERAAIAKAVQR